ncbi:MAG: tRNA (adenosine(37)-N6)-threonylcarbamoyltransferase complex transferase subunit TsaD [Oscillospiraceae bacterium]|nr:tRNA (adenosine(37)-N6)-threonylcarbamoyltransferase complex transferase subunit TsaD [Oscillospiraceae bacterium]
MIILGIESSCDETAASIVEDGKKVLSSLVLSQVGLHAKYGGVVPELASRAHTEAIYPLCENALCEAGISASQLGAIAATYAPGLIGALLVGLNFAKALAYKLSLPLVAVDHIKAHIAAAYLEHKDLKPPFLAFVASGGHTSIMEAHSHTEFALLGQTRDDAVGEAFDKTARAMGLGYPGGAAIEKYAALGDKDSFQIPFAKVGDSELDFSFSGVKTHVINHINSLKQKNGVLSEKDKQDISAAITQNIILSIVLRIRLALKKTGHKRLVCAGGVMANSHIREALARLCGELNVFLYIPDIKYCGDNAAMVAAQGYYEFQAKNTANFFQNAFATLNRS